MGSDLHSFQRPFIISYNFEQKEPNFLVFRAVTVFWGKVGLVLTSWTNSSVNIFIISNKIKSERNFILLRYLIGCYHHLPVFRDFRQRAARSWRYGWNALLIILEILDSYRSFLSLPKYQPVGQKPGLVGQFISFNSENGDISS